MPHSPEDAEVDADVETPAVAPPFPEEPEPPAVYHATLDLAALPPPSGNESDEVALFVDELVGMVARRQSESALPKVGSLSLEFVRLDGKVSHLFDPFAIEQLEGKLRFAPPTPGASYIDLRNRVPLVVRMEYTPIAEPSELTAVGRKADTGPTSTVMVGATVGGDQRIGQQKADGNSKDQPGVDPQPSAEMVTLEVPAEMGRLLRDQAARAGATVADHLRHLLAVGEPASDDNSTGFPMFVSRVRPTQEESNQLLDEMAAMGMGAAPPLPTDWSRADIYDDHD